MSDKRLSQLANLDNVPNDAMLYVVYNGESYHTTKAQLLASIENRIIAIGTITHSDLTTVFGANFQWKINGVSKTNASSITKVLTAASVGFQKVAIGVLNASNGIDVIYGDEVAIGETMVQPPTPVNTLFLTRWDIIEDVATVPTEPIVGDDFVEKAEFIQKNITGTGEISIVLDSQETNFVITSDDITMVEGTAPTSGYLSQFTRDDKIISFYNATSNPIVFKHSVEEHNFRMPDAENLTVEPNELIRFRQFKDDVLCYQFDSLSRVGGGTTPNLQQVTTAGATTSNNITIQGTEDEGKVTLLKNDETASVTVEWAGKKVALSAKDNAVNFGNTNLKILSGGISTQPNQNYFLPNKATGSYTLATTSDLENINSYSTTETLTGGTWIDDKPIYRKVIEYTFDSSGLGVSIPHGITDLENIVKGKIITQGSSRKTNLIAPSITWGDTFLNDSNVELENVNMETDITINIILEYTKTT